LVVMLQLAVAPQLEFWGIVPNLVLAMAVALAIYKENQKSDWLMLAPVVLLDILAGRPFGLITLSIWLTFSLVGWLGHSLFKQSGFVSVLVLTISGVLFYQFSFRGLAKLAFFLNLPGALPVGWGDLYADPFLPAAVLYDGVLCLLIFLLIKKFYPRWRRLLQPVAQPAIFKK